MSSPTGGGGPITTAGATQLGMALEINHPPSVALYLVNEHQLGELGRVGEQETEAQTVFWGCIGTATTAGLTIAAAPPNALGTMLTIVLAVAAGIGGLAGLIFGFRWLRVRGQRPRLLEEVKAKCSVRSSVVSLGAAARSGE